MGDRDSWEPGGKKREGGGGQSAVEQICLHQLGRVL